MKNLSKRIKHVSHIDLDGHGCTTISEFIVESYPKGMFELEISNIVPNQLFGAVKKILNEIVNYDLIVITDIAITKEIVEVIDNSGHCDKFIIIDHHQTLVDTEKYPWLHINTNMQIDGEDSDIQTCATRAYFEFLKNDAIFDMNLLHLPSMKNIEFFIDCVTSWDTRSFVNNNSPVARLYTGDVWQDIKYIAPRLNTLFHTIEKSEFKAYIKDFITNVDFGNMKKPVGVISENNKKIDAQYIADSIGDILIGDDNPEIKDKFINNIKLQYIYECDTVPSYLLLTRTTDRYPWMDKVIEIAENQNKRYIESSIKKIQIMSINKDIFKNGRIHNINCTIGLIFAEKNGCDIGELANINYPEIDLCAVVNNNQVSLYTTKDDVNVAEIAILLGGGGHKKAAGFSIEYNDSQWFNRNHFNAMFNNAGNIAVPTK